MKFLPGPRADTAVIQPESFAPAIRVEGIGPAAMAGLFHGAPGAREIWKPGLTLGAGLESDDSRMPPPATATYEKDLPDGCVQLQSGAPGQVRVTASHGLQDLLIPQALYLLLAQQWARAGLMMVHAAAFETSGRGILALGDRGAGKSVLTACALAAGARVVSDDWVLVGFDDAGALLAERMRDFLMLRHGRACDRILARLPGLAVRPSPGRPKSVIRIPEARHDGAPTQPDAARPGQDARFVGTCPIHEIWRVERPRAGRAERSSIGSAPPAAALAAVIRQTMPILFSRRFPGEGERLGRTVKAAVEQSRCRRIEGGLDLVEQPRQALARLL